MTELLRLAAHSAWNRRGTLVLTVLSIALSVGLLFGIERARVAAREGFEQSVSGTDLIVGARTSPVQLLLYAVFHIGEATNNVRWRSIEAVEANPAVAWVVPLSLGDSHKGFAVLGTTTAFFEHFQYGYRRHVALAEGRAFSGSVDGVFEAVIGSEVARTLGYRVGQRITLSHGMGGADLPEHADKPFTVVGVLAPTGTPVDRTVHISLQAIEAIHLDWQGGVPMPGLTIPAEYVRKFDLSPKTVTAALVGLKSRAAVFKVQRAINEGETDALLAVLPGIALDQLWQVVGVVERALVAMSAMVFVVGLAGMVAVVLASLNERRRELAVLRSVGAGPREIALLMLVESTAVVACGALAGVAALTLFALAARPWIEARLGVGLETLQMSSNEWTAIGCVLVAGVLAGIAPAWRACRLSLADGLTPRL